MHFMHAPHDLQVHHTLNAICAVLKAYFVITLISLQHSFHMSIITRLQCICCASSDLRWFYCVVPTLLQDCSCHRYKYTSMVATLFLKTIVQLNFPLQDNKKQQSILYILLELSCYWNLKKKQIIIPTASFWVKIFVNIHKYFTSLIFGIPVCAYSIYGYATAQNTAKTHSSTYFWVVCFYDNECWFMTSNLIEESA